MGTDITIDGTRFLINGRPTYEGRVHAGRAIEGLLFNSRMVQAIFDDENPDTRVHWAYPDTGVWDPERNTDEFCAQLATYRKHGLLAITVGLQGGGSIYTPEIYHSYRNSAFTHRGDLKPAYFDRLRRVLRAADDTGMVVIVNFLYVRQTVPMTDDAVRRAVDQAAHWLLESGYRNILVDVANESHPFWGRDIVGPGNIHELIALAQSVSRDGRRLLVSASTAGGDQIPDPAWRETEDFSLPHGNGCQPEQLRRKLQRIKQTPEYKARPRPIVVNEDSVFVENLDAAVDEGCSWGFYCQGYGSDYRDRMDWKARARESRYEDLTGFQTVPVNWSLNTTLKRDFFSRVAEITGSG